MAVIKPKPVNRIIKRSLAVAGVLTIILLAVQLWFVQNARTVFKQYIAEQSQGKIEIELKQLDLNLWSNRLQVHEAELVSTDTLNEPITYHVSFSSVSVRVGSIWGLLFHKKLLLDSLKLYNPVIQVIQWRKDTTRVVLKDELSIPQEMGKVYNSLFNALEEFAVRRIIIDNAAISLINKIKPGSQPVTVSNIFFDLARTPVRNGDSTSFRNREQTIELRSSHQDIALPGGRHHISFKSFRLRLLRQTIELDSCTVTAMPTDSLKSNYRVFFKKLSLTGVDFSALSGKNLIKADSVYCENPFFDLNLYRSDAVEKKTEIPDPNKIIRELTGNLDLTFVGVKNAGIHFDINGKTKRSFFNSNKDNFEIKRFRVNPDSLQPVSIASFNMTLRDYHLYNEDSSSMFSFDSLHFLNNKIVLNNFAILSSAGRTKLRNLVDIRVPYFELSQLDWYQLIFEQNMVAKEAVLNNPVINFTRTRSGTPGKKFDLFETLLNLDSLVALNNVSVINGEVNGRLGSTTSFSVQNIDFNIYSNKLLRSTNKEGLRSAVEHLSFSKGELRLKDITAQLQDARYTGNNLIYANKIAISGQGDKIAATVHNVLIDNLQLDDNADNIEVDGLQWEEATVALKAFPYGNNGNKDNSSSIHLRNISGNNTQLNFSNGPANISSYVQTLKASSLYKEGNKPIRVEGFIVAGNDLAVNSNTVKLNADSYKVTGSDSSSLTGFRMRRIKGIDTLNIRSSYVKFSTELNDLFANDQHLSYVHATAPVIDLNKWDTARGTPDSSVVQSPVHIDELTATEADITISTHYKDSVAVLRIPRSDKSMIQARRIAISGEGLQIDSVLVNTTAATFVKRTGEKSGVEGKIDMTLSNITFGKKDGKIHWSGFINDLNLVNANGLQTGKSKKGIRFEQATLGNLNLSSDFLPDLNQLLKANMAAWLHIPRGEFIDSSRTLKWYNANYVNSTRTLSLDSFVYHPTKTLDSVLASAPYQLDYITLKTGLVTVAGLDVERYEKDSSFIANTITIDKPLLTVYRDKKPPSSPYKKTKPLPVDMIKNISFPVSVQSIQFDEGTITYSEKNGNSRKQGDLLLTRVSGILENIKNNHLLDDDSLSLTFKASLMDSAHITLSLKESYTDSLSGFLLKAKITSADLSVANPVLVPLLNVKIASGFLDSVSLLAVGRQDVALGEMKLHYHKLGVRLVKDGKPDESTFFQHVFSFFANTFVIKSKNTKRIGTIFSKRSTEQSFVNYIVRTSLSGIMSTVGIKSGRKYMKQYKRELRASKRPPIKL